jgi:H+-translocating NAD(P) transhydrogenase subunit beta
MLLAVAVTLLDQDMSPIRVPGGRVVIGAVIGAVLALKIQMTAMPQLVGLLNGFGGGASVMVAGAELICAARAAR